MLHFESGEEYDTVFNIDLFVIQSEFVNIYIYIYIYLLYIYMYGMYVCIYMFHYINHHTCCKPDF